MRVWAVSRALGGIGRLRRYVGIAARAHQDFGAPAVDLRRRDVQPLVGPGDRDVAGPRVEARDLSWGDVLRAHPREAG